MCSSDLVQKKVDYCIYEVENTHLRGNKLVIAGYSLCTVVRERCLYCLLFFVITDSISSSLLIQNLATSATFVSM